MARLTQLLQQEKETLDQRKQEYESEIGDLKRNSKYLQEEIERLQKVNTEFSTTEESRRNKYEAAVSSLEKIENRIQSERAQEVEERTNSELERLGNLRQTWLNHENNVKGTIRSLALRHSIDYIEKVPFRGTPDNTLFICEEYVVFVHGTYNVLSSLLW